MTTFFKNHSTILFVLLLLTMLLLTWPFPSSRFIIEVTFILMSLALASLLVTAKNRESYQQGRLTKRAFVRSTIFDILSLLLAMNLAGLLTHYIAQRLTPSVDNELLRIGVVLMLSLLGGVSMGLLMKRMRGYVIASPPK